jgi:hypothetical protein
LKGFGASFEGNALGVAFADMHGVEHAAPELDID